MGRQNLVVRRFCYFKRSAHSAEPTAHFVCVIHLSCGHVRLLVLLYLYRGTLLSCHQESMLAINAKLHAISSIHACLDAQYLYPECAHIHLYVITRTKIRRQCERNQQ